MIRTFTTLSLIAGLFIALSSCTNETEQRKEELKREIKAIGKERDQKTEEFAKNSERLVEELSLMQELKRIDSEADVSGSEATISKLEQKNKKLEAELKAIEKKSETIMAEFKQLK